MAILSNSNHQHNGMEGTKQFGSHWTDFHVIRYWKICQKTFD